MVSISAAMIASIAIFVIAGAALQIGDTYILLYIRSRAELAEAHNLAAAMLALMVGQLSSCLGRKPPAEALQV